MMASCSSADQLSTRFRGPYVSDTVGENELSLKIQRHYDAHKQTEAQLLNKNRARKSIEDLLKLHLHPGARVTIVGSTMTTFATANSDMDIVLTAPIDLTSVVEQSRVFRILKDKGDMRILEFRNGPTVKVPIIRGEDLGGSVRWGMSFNKVDGIIKTKLLRAYSLLDERVAPLVVTVKNWAEEAKVRDAHDGTLSSFSWTLLVICYLQSGSGSNPVVPCLQKQYPVKYGDISDALALDIDVEESPPTFTSTNRSNLGKLLNGFFQFYTTTFKYDSKAVSVREGGLISKYQICSRPPHNQWKYFCIEEPYGTVRTNTARAMFKPGPCSKVIKALRDADTQLSTYNTLNPPLAG